MADGPFPIKLTLNITAGNEKPISDTTEFSVQALCITQVVVPIGGQVKEVSVAPEVADALNFHFLLVRPTLLGQAPIKQADLIDKKEFKKDVLTYSVPVPKASASDQRKPLRGTHVFAAGQTEWVTDMLKEGKPGGLTKLRFWNDKPEATEDDMTQAEKDKLLKDKVGDERAKAIKEWAKGRHDITVQVITGYLPLLSDSY